MVGEQHTGLEQVEGAFERADLDGLHIQHIADRHGTSQVRSQ